MIKNRLVYELGKRIDEMREAASRWLRAARKLGSNNERPNKVYPVYFEVLPFSQLVARSSQLEPPSHGINFSILSKNL